jgi:hypothetical protein
MIYTVISAVAWGEGFVIIIKRFHVRRFDEWGSRIFGQFPVLVAPGQVPSGRLAICPLTARQHIGVSKP